MKPADLDGTNGFCDTCKQYRRLHDHEGKRICGGCYIDVLTAAPDPNSLMERQLKAAREMGACSPCVRGSETVIREWIREEIEKGKAPKPEVKWASPSEIAAVISCKSYNFACDQGRRMLDSVICYLIPSSFHFNSVKAWSDQWDREHAQAETCEYPGCQQAPIYKLGTSRLCHYHTDIVQSLIRTLQLDASGKSRLILRETKI